MNSSNYRFSLNLHSTQSQISIPAMLGDTGRTWYINLSDGDKIYFIEDGCLAKLTIKRPTGTYHEEFCEIRENATIVYPFDKNTCATVGLHNCEVILYGLNGEILGSPRFAMVVSDRVIRDDDINLSDSDRAILDSMVVEEANRRVAEEGRVSAESARAARFDDTVAGMNTQFGETVEGMNTRFDQTIESMNAQFDQTIEDTNKELGKAVEDIKEEYKIPAIHIGPDAPSKGGDLWIDTDEEEEDDVDIDVTAKVGQVIAVKSVDEDGKPVEFKAVDLPTHDQPDWNAAEGKAGHVLNRTHYVDEKGVIHKLPNKFIDADWMATSEEGGGDYLIIPEQDVSGGMWKNRNMEIQPGLEYDVYINGVVYPCVAFNDDESIVLGNNMALNKNNLPFCVVWAGGTATAGMFLHNNTLGSPIYLKVTDHKYTIYNKLPKGFLPDISWNELTDKPFVEGAGALLFSHTATFATDAAATAGAEVDVGAVSPDYNNVYWLEVNGELLKCHWERVDWVTSGLYDEDHNEWMRTVTAAVYVSAPKAGTYAYNLYKTSDELMLDPQYIPPNVARKSDIPEGGGGADIDVTAEVGQTIIVKEVDADGKPTKWESADYQPRTHWSEEGKVQVSDLPLGVSSLSSIYGVFAFMVYLNEYARSEPITAVASIEYDGVEYTDLPSFSYNGINFFGNLYFLNATFGTSFENTGEPFVLASAVAGTMMMTTDTESTRHSIQIYIEGTNFHRIDRHYQPQLPIVDLTKYYSADDLNGDNAFKTTISGGNYYAEVYWVLRANDMVKVVYFSPGGDIGTAAVCPNRLGGTVCASIFGGVQINANDTQATIGIA